MTNSAELLERRKKLVPNAIGIFNPSTAVSARDCIVVDADGNELIDFAGGIGVVNAGHCPPPVTAAIAKHGRRSRNGRRRTPHARASGV